MGAVIACGVFLLIIACVGVVGTTLHHQVTLFFVSFSAVMPVIKENFRKKCRRNWDERFYNRMWHCWNSDANIVLPHWHVEEQVFAATANLALFSIAGCCHRVNLILWSWYNFCPSLEVSDWQLNSSVGDWTVSSKLWPNGTIEILLLLLLLLLLLYHCHHRHYH